MLYFENTNKLYAPTENGYKSIDIVSGNVVFNNIETLSDKGDGFPLTQVEFDAKFHIKDFGNYTFPRARTSTMSLSSGVTEETTETPKKTIKSTKSKIK